MLEENVDNLLKYQEQQKEITRKFMFGEDV